MTTFNHLPVFHTVLTTHLFYVFQIFPILPPEIFFCKNSLEGIVLPQGAHEQQLQQQWNPQGSHCLQCSARGAEQQLPQLGELTAH